MFWKIHCLWVLLVIFSATFKPAWAIRCYNCTGYKSQFCGSNFDANHVAQIDCEEGQVPLKHKYACMFLNETDTRNGHSTIIRRCMVRHRLNDGCDYIFETSKIISKTLETNCIECKTDLCNSASPVYKLAVPILILITLYLTK